MYKSEHTNIRYQLRYYGFARHLRNNNYVIDILGTGEGDKAQFIRLSDTTPYSNMQKLLQSEWELELPKLIITVRDTRTTLASGLRRSFVST